MKINNFKITFFVFALGFSQIAYAQNENELVEDSIVTYLQTEKVVWDMSFAFKSMNVFRGILPSRTPVLSTQAGIKYKDFVLGLYGGSSFGAGSPSKEAYTETDLILMYYKPKIDIQAQWYYNFTTGVTHIKSPTGFFDFNSETSIAMLDAIVNVRLPHRFTLTSSTLLFGRDKVPFRRILITVFNYFGVSNAIHNILLLVNTINGEAIN